MVTTLLSLDGGFTIAPSDYDPRLLANFSPYYHTTSPAAIFLTAGSFWALVVCIPGLVWHLKNRSLAASSMVGWIIILNIMSIINVLLWPNDNVSKWWDGQIYCDAEIKLEIAGTMGLVGSLGCIMRALAQALDTSNLRVMASKGQRLRQRILEIALCVLFPLILALLHFVIQPLRYYVFAIAGCKASYSSAWYTIPLSHIWPPIICLFDVYYASLLAIRICRYRRQISSILSNSTSGMNKSRFLRLFTSSMVVLLIVLPIQAYSVYVNTANGLQDTWNPTSWQTIVLVPTYGLVFPDRWIRLGAAVPVFFCFCWGRDANSVYKSWLHLLGFTKCVPSLAEPDLRGIYPTSRGVPEGNHPDTSAGSSTLFSKAKTFFSLGSKMSQSGSVFSSLSSGERSIRKANITNDIESQHSALELQTEKVLSDGVKDVSVSNALSYGLEEYEVAKLEPVAKKNKAALKTSQNAKERAKEMADYEKMIEDCLT